MQPTIGNELASFPPRSVVVSDLYADLGHSAFVQAVPIPDSMQNQVAPDAGLLDSGTHDSMPGLASRPSAPEAADPAAMVSDVSDGTVSIPQNLPSSAGMSATNISPTVPSSDVTQSFVFQVSSLSDSVDAPLQSASAASRPDEYSVDFSSAPRAILEASAAFLPTDPVPPTSIAQPVLQGTTATLVQPESAKKNPEDTSVPDSGRSIIAGEGSPRIPLADKESGLTSASPLRQKDGGTSAPPSMHRNVLAPTVLTPPSAAIAAGTPAPLPAQPSPELETILPANTNPPQPPEPPANTSSTYVSTQKADSAIDSQPDDAGNTSSNSSQRKSPPASTNATDLVSPVQLPTAGIVVADPVAQAPNANSSTSHPAANDTPLAPNETSNLRLSTQYAASSPGPVQLAQIVHNAAQSNMRIGLNTASFGSVEVRTTVHANEVGVSIGTEKGDLRSLLTTELPAITGNLQQQNLRLTQVSFHQQGFSSSNNLMSGGDSQSRSFSAKPGFSVRSIQEPPAVESGLSTDTPIDRNTGLSILA